MKNYGQIIVFSIILSLSFQLGVGVSSSFVDENKKELSEDKDSPLKEKEDVEDLDLKPPYTAQITQADLLRVKRTFHLIIHRFSVLTGFITTSFEPPEAVC